MQLKRRKIPMCFKFCRKIFGTYLRQRGFVAEIVDLLEGRIGKSVFARHYFRPDIDEQRKQAQNSPMDEFGVRAKNMLYNREVNILYCILDAHLARTLCTKAPPKIWSKM
jgi:hypothetical protein